MISQLSAMDGTAYLELAALSCTDVNCNKIGMVHNQPHKTKNLDVLTIVQQHASSLTFVQIVAEVNVACAD